MEVEVSSIAMERLARVSELLIGYMGIDMVITMMSCDR
jgi:hypothetical protein